MKKHFQFRKIIMKKKALPTDPTPYWYGAGSYITFSAGLYSSSKSNHIMGKELHKIILGIVSRRFGSLFF
jgi:hypothetical protein